MKILASFTIFSCLGAILVLTDVFLGSHPQGAISQAVEAAVSVALAVIPYCLMRAAQCLETTTTDRHLAEISQTLATHTKLLAEVANNSASELPPPPSAESRSAETA